MASRPPVRPASASNQSLNSTTISASTATANLQQPPRRMHQPYFQGSMNRRPPAPASQANEVRPMALDAEDSSADIIVRDERGDYRLDLPSMTPLPRDEAKDEREMENRLIETYRKHHQQIEPNELKATLQASLQAKVASLDEDAWMFEGEEVTPLHSEQ